MEDEGHGIALQSLTNWQLEYQESLQWWGTQCLFKCRGSKFNFLSINTLQRKNKCTKTNSSTYCFQYHTVKVSLVIFLGSLQEFVQSQFFTIISHVVTEFVTPSS